MNAFATAVQTATVETKPKPKKSTIPVLEHDDHLAELADTYQEAKVNMKQAEAVMNQAGEQIIKVVQERQDRDGYAGKFANSYQVNGSRHQVKVVYQNRFSINPQDKGELKNILGNEYERMIVEKPTVKLRAEVLENQELQEELMKCIGGEFAKFFEATVELAVAEGFSKDIYRAVAPEDLSELRLYAKQFKPSLR
jgi:hypothetical protein